MVIQRSREKLLIERPREIVIERPRELVIEQPREIVLQRPRELIEKHDGVIEENREIIIITEMPQLRHEIIILYNPPSFDDQREFCSNWGYTHRRGNSVLFV